MIPDPTFCLHYSIRASEFCNYMSIMKVHFSRKSGAGRGQKGIERPQTFKFFNYWPKLFSLHGRFLVQKPYFGDECAPGSPINKFVPSVPVEKNIYSSISSFSFMQENNLHTILNSLM